MGNSKKIIDANNRELEKKLIPNKNLPIFGNSFLDPNDEIFCESFEQIKYEKLLDIIEYQEWNLQFEQIKNNLKIE